MMSGKKAFLELLKQEGVDIVFGNPGTTELPLMDAFATENEIRYLLGLQEAAIMSMADGYAQASGKLAVCNFHTTPGLGNALGMLYDAQKAGAPLLVTAGQHDQTFNVTEPILWAALPPIARVDDRPGLFTPGGSDPRSSPEPPHGIRFSCSEGRAASGRSPACPARRSPA